MTVTLKISRGNVTIVHSQAIPGRTPAGDRIVIITGCPDDLGAGEVMFLYQRTIDFSSRREIRWEELGIGRVVQG